MWYVISYSCVIILVCGEMNLRIILASMNKEAKEYAVIGPYIDKELALAAVL